MPGGALWQDILLMLSCYGYIGAMILVSGRLEGGLGVSRRASRKFLHAMIGNLPFAIPFFDAPICPFLVASPFILVTFMASPYSPFEGAGRRLRGLVDITEEGHHTGLILYAASYSVLALLYASKPWVIAAGILPMAHGDSAAALVGERMGRHRYRIVEEKSVEGSTAMFMVSFLSFAASLLFFSALYPFSFSDMLAPALAVAAVATVVEALTPRGLDNLSVPLSGALAFLALRGGL